MTSPVVRTRVDVFVLCLASLGIIAICLSAYTTLTHAPAEDAVILHQYSRNLAATGIISYIPGGQHAEGATDFLWMLYIALGIKLHLTPTLSTAIANAVCMFALSCTLQRLAHRSVHLANTLAVVGALSLMPQMISAAAGFSVIPFALAISTTVLFSEEDHDRATALSALLLCLLRPDGVVFAVPIIIRKLWRFPRRSSLYQYASFFVLPGTLYFMWRWHYFGYFLPLPFLVKSDTHRVLGLFAPTAHELIRYLLFAMFIVLAALGKRMFYRTQLSLLFAIVLVPSLFYSAMRLDQNLFFRFYYFVPLSVSIMLALNWPLVERNLKATVGIAALAILLLLVKTDMECVRNYESLSQYWARNERVAKQLSSLRGILLTSEAGELAYFSRWTTFDSWGLNTPEFATHLILPEDVIKLRPDLIALHTVDCDPKVNTTLRNRDFDAMYSNVLTGVAQLKQYQVWRMPSPVTRTNENLCWYIRDDYPAKEKVSSILISDGAVQQ